MEKAPVKVKLVGKDQIFYKIQFPNLQIPVQVNDDLYQRMSKSKECRFIGDSRRYSWCQKTTILRNRFFQSSNLLYKCPKRGLF